MGIPGAKEFWAKSLSKTRERACGVFQNQEEDLLSRMYLLKERDKGTKVKCNINL